MNNFNFYNPTRIIFGKNTIPKIGKEISRRGYKKILILAGSGSIKSNGVYEESIESLKKSTVQWIEHWGVRPNPVLSHAEEGINFIRENKLEAILAIGGGSVIDEAKSIAAGYYMDNLWTAFEQKTNITKALPIFSILTLSGTCSEMDPFAVLTNDKELKKWNIGGDALFPTLSIIDPSVQMSLPWHQTVNGGIDAISHIMEFYFMGIEEEVSIALDESLIRTLIKCLDQLQENQKDYNSRANLAWSATLALNGISGVGLKGGDWAVHRIEHSISALYPEVAHGAGLAVIFPAWIKYMQNENPPQFQRWAGNLWNTTTVDEAVELMKAKYRSWGAPVSLRDLGIERGKIPELAGNTMMFGALGQLRDLTEDDVINIMNIAY